MLILSVWVAGAQAADDHEGRVHSISRTQVRMEDSGGVSLFARQSPSPLC